MLPNIQTYSDLLLMQRKNMFIYDREARFCFILALISVIWFQIILSVGRSQTEEAVFFFFLSVFFCIGINEQSIVSRINQIKFE